MCEQVNINVQETNETINIVSSEIQEVIDINVFETTEDVTLNITEQLIQVNINKVTAAEQIQSDWAQTDNEALDFIKNKPTIPTNTSDLTNDGEDGVNPFITAADIPASLLVALPFTTDHLTATNNAYVIGDVVWYLGNVYRCIANNDSRLPTSTTYWTNLGAGNPLVEQPSDWNSTSGNNQILNKPTIPTGTVTSVGLTMPSAFSVANSPITSSGDIAVTGAGVVSQYVRGDGSLANFPTSTGGGASLSFYLNGSVSQGTIGGVAFREMDRTPILGAGTDFTIAANGYIQSFITDANVPNLLEIPAGNWNFETYFSASSNGGSPSFYLELYKWNGTTLSLIASNSATPEGITNGTAIDLYVSALAVPQTTLLATDRLAIRIYVTHSGRTIKLHTENSHLCQVITTFSTGLTALNGLTTQVQSFATGTSGTDFAISSATATHTFNLPTASATNRGALSSANWSTFNGKFTLPTLTSGSVLFSNGTTIAQDNAQLFWDDTNNRLGIGTATPAKKLDVVGSIRTNDQIESSKVLNSATISNAPADASLLLYAPTTAGNYGGIIGWAEGNVAASISAYDAGSGGALGLSLATGNNTSISERMRIFSNGNIGINTTTDAGYKLDVNGTARIANKLSVGTPSAASAITEITSTTQGFLPPRMTTTQKNAIATPAAGLVVYDTTLNKLCLRTAAAWEVITSI